MDQNTKRDFKFVIIIGALVGLLVQPIVAHFIGYLSVQLSRYGFPGSNALIRICFFLLFFILAPVALYVAYAISKKISFVYEFAKFAAVGALNSFFDLGVFNLLTVIYGAEPQNVLFSAFKAFSFLCATTNSFFWNKYWTFHSEQKAGPGEVVKFYSVAILGGLLNVSIATLVYRAHHPDAISSNLWLNIISPIAGILSAFIWNYIGYKFFVFKKHKSEIAA